jgi:hypothetical protein
MAACLLSEFPGKILLLFRAENVKPGIEPAKELRELDSRLKKAGFAKHGWDEKRR